MKNLIRLGFSFWLLLLSCNAEKPKESSKIELVKQSHGLFCNTWEPKEFVVPLFEDYNAENSDSVQYIITVDFDAKLGKVSPYLSGINATTYNGNYLNDGKMLDLVSSLKPSLIRFPGGDASNMYFFNGLPNDLPPKAYTFNGEWTDFLDGTANVSWKMNTAQYYALLDSIGSEGMITVNYPYARYGLSEDPVAKAASLAADWVRFDKGRTKFWEIGNETYACWEGGFRIDTTLNADDQPEYINGKLYGEHFRVFADSMRAAAQQINAEIYIGAIFADDDGVWDGSDRHITKNWNDALAPEIRRKDGTNYADFISVHSYFLNKNEKTPSEVIQSYTVAQEVQHYIHLKLDRADVAHVPLALSEWNIKEPHQTSQVSGLQAISTLCKMQEIGFGASTYFSLKDYWRNEKGDFGIFSHNDPHMPNSEPYPVFYHFYFLEKTLGDQMVKVHISPENETILCFASSFHKGGLGLVVINTSREAQNFKLNVANLKLNKKFFWYELSKYNDGNEWSEKVEINGFTNSIVTKGGPSDNFHKIPAHAQTTKNGIQLEVKGLSATYLMVDGKN